MDHTLGAEALHETKRLWKVMSLTPASHFWIKTSLVSEVIRELKVTCNLEIPGCAIRYFSKLSWRETHRQFRQAEPRFRGRRCELLPVRLVLA